MHFPQPESCRCRVSSVHDGDTLTVVADLGYFTHREATIRLLDVYAPELSQQGGKETGDFVRSWLTEHSDHSDWPFLVTTDRTGTDSHERRSFTRYIGTITDAQGASLNKDTQEWITAQGYGPGVTEVLR